MPCYDGQSAHLSELEAKAREENPLRFAMKDALKAQERLDKLCSSLEIRCHQLTDMLCRLCNQMDNLPHAGESAFDMVSEDIQQWWQEHKKWDEERKK